MYILITGGAGFIGSNFIRYILTVHPGWQIVNLDKLAYAGNLENLKDVEDNPSYTFIRGDIADAGLVAQLFGRYKFDAVINLAAESHVDRSILDSTPFVETNIKGTQVLLDAVRRHGTGMFIQVSTDEVYGSLNPDDPAFTEENPVRPNSPYAASKAAADLMVLAYVHTYGLKAIITRCSNNYGPYQFPEKLIPLMITNAFEDRELPVYGNGQNVRDWIHVEDHCRAIELALLKGEPGQIYNIGARCEMANLEVVKLILKAAAKPETLIRFVADRPGHDLRYAIDPTKTAERLGWQPRYRLPEYMPELVRWYRENEGWWRRIKSGEYMNYYQTMYGSRLKSQAK